MRTYQIECGAHRGEVKAKGMGSAWRKLTKKRVEGFAELARVRALDDDGMWGVWMYAPPETFDGLRP